MKNDRKVIDNLENLLSLYGDSAPASIAKELDYISPHYQQMIERSPFAVFCTVGSGGLDCSPRGDAPGFIRVRDNKTLLLPDRRGNNRLDSLRNLVEDPRASILFLIPGIGETLRVNGRAVIIQDSQLQQSFEVNGKAPVTIVEFTVERIYFQCQKALVKAIKKDFDAKAYDDAYPERLKKTLY